MKHAELREAVCEGNIALVRHGLVLLAFGNVSAVDRTAGVVAIKPSGLACETVRPADISVVALETGEIVAGDRRPSSDTPTHLTLYRAFESAQAIVHTHSRFATSWAQAEREIPCLGTTHADHFQGPIRVTRRLSNAEIASDYERNTGQAIVDRFAAGDWDPVLVPAVLVTQHGPFIWSQSIAGAVDNARALEEVATMAFYCKLLSPAAEALPDALLVRHYARKHGPGAYYGQSVPSGVG